MNTTMDVPRVLHIFVDPATGVFLLQHLAKRQAQEGFLVEFACGHGEYLTQLKLLGFPVHVGPLTRHAISFSHLQAIYWLRTLLKNKSYQIVHVHTPIASFLGRVAAFSVGIPLVFYHMRGSMWDSPILFVRLIFTLVEWLSAHWTSHTFTINCQDRLELISRKISKPEDVTCLHCGGGGLILIFSPLQ